MKEKVKGKRGGKVKVKNEGERQTKKVKEKKGSENGKYKIRGRGSED